MEKNNKKIIFDLPGETVLVDVFDEILKNNGLEETTDDFLKSIENNQEPRVLILIDSAKVIFQKKISEEKTVELLQKHLKTSKEVAEKIVTNIKQKIIPYAKEVSTGEYEKEQRANLKLSSQEIILKKIKENTPIEQYDSLSEEKVKIVEIKDVDKNARNMKKFTRGTDIVAPKTSVVEDLGDQLKNKKHDVYREPIE